MIRSYRTELSIAVVVFVVFLVGAVFFTGPVPIESVHSLRNWQEADAPAGYPIGASDQDPEGFVPAFDERFVLLDAFERFLFPPASRLDQPLGTETGALTYDAQPFLTKNEERGNRLHLGADLNGIGGMNTDLGDPVYAVGNGVVVYAGDLGPGWGEVVILGHRRPDGSLLQSFYGHLDRMQVTRGEQVARGQQIGTVGTGGAWPAHLHFEIYEGSLLDPHGGGYRSHGSNRIDPLAEIARHRPASSADLSPEPLGLVEPEPQIFRIGPGGQLQRLP